MSDTITVNGQPHAWRDQSLMDLLADFGVGPDRSGVAVALNADVVARRAWPSRRLAPGDRIEIVHIVRGG